MDPFSLVIFDYSGTLSTGAVEFGRPEILQRQLDASGLAGFGIDTPGRYWEALANPTWVAAGTAAEGFIPIAARRIQELAEPGTDPAAIRAAVGRFVDAYLRHSKIDAGWRPLLADIQDRPATLGLIATDHYAEATAAIQSHLAAFNIRAASAKNRDDRTAFVIANSADIGCLKAEPQFWQRLKTICLPIPPGKLILVDDFGANEPAQSSYTGPGRIAARIAETRRTLDRVFARKPQVVHHLAGEDPVRAVSTAVETVRKILAQ